MKDIFKKIARAYREKRLLKVFNSRLRFFYGRLRSLLVCSSISKRITLHCPEYAEPPKDKNEIELVKRIFQAFKKMKEDQVNVSKV
mgnify:CR=1 FL=1